MSEWPVRIMVYAAGEAVAGSGALAPQIQAQIDRLGAVCTNAFVAATAQLDSSNAPTARFVLDPLKRQPVNKIPNVDVGDPNQLLDFVTWSAAICPAARTVLVLSGHGAAWEDGQVDQILGTRGLSANRSVMAARAKPGAVHHPLSLFGYDVSPAGAATKAVLIDGQDRDYLSNSELGAACQRICTALGRRIDVLVFDACLMSAWELLQELRGSVATVVASIDELSAAGIDMAGPAQKLTAAQGALDARGIAASIAQGFSPQAPFDSCVAIDLGSPGWGAALSSFQDFCANFLPWIQASPANASAALGALRLAATSVVQFTSGGLADVGALADAIGNLPNAPAAVTGNIRAAAAALRSGVIGRTAGRDYQNALGMSIFAPGSASAYATNRPDYTRLQFAGLTGWSAILDVLHGYQSDHVRSLENSAGRPSVPASGDSEFVVSLRGLPIDGQTRDRLDKIVRRTVLEKLAMVDALGDVSVTPLNAGANMPAARFLLGTQTLGLVISRDLLRGLAHVPPPTIQPERPIELRDSGETP